MKSLGAHNLPGTARNYRVWRVLLENTPGSKLQSSYNHDLPKRMQNKGFLFRVDQNAQSVQAISASRRTAPNGLVFFVRLGGKPIEFEKGKAGIAVASVEKLPQLIDTVIAALRNGELDDVLAQTAKGRTMPKRKAA